MSRLEELIVGLDIGTTKTSVVVAEVAGEQINILGYGCRESRGIFKGMVVNVDQTVDSIKQAIEDAEMMANCSISTVHVGITGGHIKSINSHGIVPVNKAGEVKDEDVLQVIENAKAISIPMDRQIIHIFPREYIIDGQNGIKEPCGISGVRLEAKVHIVTAAVASTQNLAKCASRCDLTIGEMILSSVASSEACLTDEEREIGTVLIDMGGGTTDVAVFEDGAIVFSTVVALGGNNLTKDVATGLETPLAEAERLKCRFGLARASMAKEEMIEVPGVGGRAPRQESRQKLCGIIEPRVEELFDLVKAQLRNGQVRDYLPGGVVITGGCANLPGIVEVAEEVLGMSTRVGVPKALGGIRDSVTNPSFSCVLGMILYDSLHKKHNPFRPAKRRRFKRLIGWFKDIF